MTKKELKELELLKYVCYMGVQWALSLIDCDVPGGKSELKKAQKAHKMITDKLKKK